MNAALRAAKGRGFEQTTIRSLADDLGVAPMSLYRHIRGKDDLLDEVFDVLLRRAWRPSAPASEWRAWITEAAERLRRLLVDEPAGGQAEGELVAQLAAYTTPRQFAEGLGYLLDGIEQHRDRPLPGG